MNYLPDILLSILVLALLFITFFIIQERKYREKVKRAFEGREEMSPPDFYAAYFKPEDVSMDIVTRVIRILEQELGEDLSRLSAEDDFTKNLSFFFDNDSMFEVELVLRLEEEFGITITDAEAGDLTWNFTLRNVINLVNDKLSSKTTDSHHPPAESAGDLTR